MTRAPVSEVGGAAQCAWRRQPRRTVAARTAWAVKSCHTTSRPLKPASTANVLFEVIDTPAASPTLQQLGRQVKHPRCRSRGLLNGPRGELVRPQRGPRICWRRLRVPLREYRARSFVLTKGVRFRIASEELQRTFRSHRTWRSSAAAFAVGRCRDCAAELTQTGAQPDDRSASSAPRNCVISVVRQSGRRCQRGAPCRPWEGSAALI